MAAMVVPNAAAKSVVWTYFGFPGSPDGSTVTKKRVVCRICHQETPYKNNTSNMFAHLERHHKDEYAKLRAPTTQSKEAKQSSLSASFASATPQGSGSDQHKQLVDAIAGFVVQDMRPLSVMEGEGFRKLMKVAEPRFKLPSRTHFTQTVIPAKYLKVRSGVESFLSSIQYCSITTDLWSIRQEVT